MVNKIKSAAGRKGAEATHRRRYEVLVELTKFYGKKYQLEFLTWPTKYLERLLEANKK